MVEVGGYGLKIWCQMLRSFMSVYPFGWLVSVSEDKGYICKIAKTPAEAVILIEDGFEEHTSFDNGETKLFRKRKT